MTEMNNDWLDTVLQNHPAKDEGFAERVIAIDRSQRRSRFLFLGVIGLLVAGFAAASATALLARALERWNTSAFFDAEDAESSWFASSRPEFRARFTRFDALPALARRTGRDASPVLDPVVLALEQATPRAAACVDEVNDKPERDVASSRCDTSFIDGLAAYDEWRHVGRVMPSKMPSKTDGVVSGDGALPEVARTHLRRAAAKDGAAFAAAARDVEALARLTFGWSMSGGRILTVVHEEHALAEKNGRSGDFLPAIAAADVGPLTVTWLGALGFAGPAATDDDVAFVAAGRSVLSCAARADVNYDFALQQEFLEPARMVRSAVLTPDGCAPPVKVGAWYLCGDEPTLMCRAVGGLLHLPGAKWLMARTVEGVRVRPSFTAKRSKA